MGAYGLSYSYIQSWTHSSKGYLVYGPYFPRYSWLYIRKCTKFNRLLDYLTHCVQRADLSFMENYDPYYSYSQSWTHCSQGYLVHGPYCPRYTCLDKGNCTMYKRLSEHMNCCFQRAGIHFMEAYHLYYLYSQSWIHSANSYLVHGPHFPRYKIYENAQGPHLYPYAC